jgi:YHS domain-containing protein
MPLPEPGPETIAKTPAAPLRPAASSRWRALVLAARIVQVRLRFLLVLLVAFGVVGQWQLLRNYWDKLTRSSTGADPSHAVSLDTEYFCPMCPGVLSDWPSKCPVCNMALVPRKKGEPIPLPNGVVARMQLSPYRVQLAGIRTSNIEYRPLMREIVTAGFVEPLQTPPNPLPDLRKARVRAEVFEKDLPFLAEGQAVEVSSEVFPGHAPFPGTVQRISPHLTAETHSLAVQLEVDNSRQELRPGLFVTARIQVPVQQIEPFRSMPTGPPPLRSGDSRLVFVCPEHPNILQEKPGRCPVDSKDELEARPLASNQRLEWWCPMHAHVTAAKPGCECRECKGMQLLPRVVTYNPPGEVLAVPESAVVHTGSKKVVYLERMPGMFDGVEVVLGPRCGDFFPVVRGLEAGQRVATAGAFLIDAETRLNPSLAASYFGAARNSGPTPERRDSSPSSASPSGGKRDFPALLLLSPADRDLAAKQKICPVTGEPLGSMGTPMRVVLGGKTVFLCCKGCEPELRQNPAKYLAKLPVQP